MNINLKETLNGLFSYLLAGIFLLGFLFFWVGIDGNKLFVGIGTLILLPFAIWFFIQNRKLKKLENENEIEIENLKKYGEKIIVNLENLKIKSNSWQQEVIKSSKYEDEITNIDVNYNMINIDIPYKGENINYCVHINMENTKLKMHFAIKRETILYVDRNDKNKNYLDLEFLD